MATRYDENDPPLEDANRAAHAAAGHVPTEENVPNEAKALPTTRPTAILLSALATLLAIITIVIGFALGMKLAGFMLGIVAALVAILALVMAWDDARISRLTPGLATATAVIVAIVAGLHWANARQAIEQANPARALIGNDVTLPQDQARPAAAREPR